MTNHRQARRLPLSRRRIALIALVAGLVPLAIWLLRDTLTFEALRANRETLLAWRDANYLAAVAGYMLIYAVVIALSLSLPGGAVMTLTGGFPLRASGRHGDDCGGGDNGCYADLPRRQGRLRRCLAPATYGPIL